MNALLKLSRLIDKLSEFIGKTAIWLVLVVVLISAANAVMRYTIDYSSNAYLEVQWYLFGLIFFSCSGYTLLRNEHIRIDVLYTKFSRRTQIKIDIFGILFFLMPMVVGVIVLSWPVFVDAFESGEMSNSAGGGGADCLAGTLDVASRILPARVASGVGIDQAGRFPQGHVP